MDGLVTVRDVETGVASAGETKSEPLAMLAGALERQAGRGGPVEDEDAFLEEIGLDPEEIAEPRVEHDERPEFLGSWSGRASRASRSRRH